MVFILRYPSLLLCSILLMGTVTSVAQEYHQITGSTGTQTIGDNTITISASGAVLWGTYNCSVGPYIIGSGTSSFPKPPGSYSFAFAKAVTRVKVQNIYINPGESVSFVINGIPYFLTSNNLQNFTGCNTPQASVAGGVLTSGNYSGTQAEVVFTGCIHSVKVINDSKGDGSFFGIFFSTEYKATNNGPVCEGDTIKLSGTTPITDAFYSWKGPEGFSANQQNPQLPHAKPGNSGIYTLTVHMCDTTYTDTTRLTVLPGPKPKATYNRPLCTDDDLHLSAAPEGSGVEYLWTGPNRFNTKEKNPVLKKVAPKHAGYYTLKVTSENCSARDSVWVQVGEPVMHSFTEITCFSEGYDFDGKTLFESGTYKATYPATNGCDSTSILSLVVVPSPEVYITYDNHQYCLGDTISLYAHGAQNFEWQTPVKQAGTTLQTVLQLPSNKITLVGLSGNNCRDTSIIDVAAQSCCYLNIPNAFSPNGDALNDQFGPLTTGHFHNYTLSIYNKWGQCLYTSYNIDQKWDGTFKGQLVDMGTYYYNISADCLDKTGLKRKGEITLIR